MKSKKIPSLWFPSFLFASYFCVVCS